LAKIFGAVPLTHSPNLAKRSGSREVLVTEAGVEGCGGGIVVTGPLAPIDIAIGCIAGGVGDAGKYAIDHGGK
jgi:hypothetical protein